MIILWNTPYAASFSNASSLFPCPSPQIAADDTLVTWLVGHYQNQARTTKQYLFTLNPNPGIDFLETRMKPRLAKLFSIQSIRPSASVLYFPKKPSLKNLAYIAFPEKERICVFSF